MQVNDCPARPPLARWLALVAFALAVLASIYAKGRIGGREGAIAKIEAENTKAQSKADAAERDVMACPPGKWNKEGRKCAME